MKIPVIIPDGAKLLLKKGQKVDYDTVFVKRQSEDEMKLPIAASLGFSPDKIFMFLHKFVGDKVEKNEVLAERKAMMSTKQYVSEFSGVIKEINHNDGSVTLSTQADDSVEEYCYFKGEVEEIDGNVVLVKVGRGKQYQLHEPSSFFGGQVLIHEDTHPSQITEEQVDSRVVVGDKIPSYDHMKMEALGAVGFILLQQPDDTSSVPVALLKQIADYEEIKKSKFTCCNIGPDRTTIYFYD
jgi:DNA-directed RNA polymerase alpha subunit